MQDGMDTLELQDVLLMDSPTLELQVVLLINEHIRCAARAELVWRLALTNAYQVFWGAAEDHVPS